MKTMQVACLALLASVLVSLTFSGCASHSGASAHHCAQCSCKMMQEDPANPGKCKMCGHDAKAHGTDAAPKSEEKHVH